MHKEEIHTVLQAMMDEYLHKTPADNPLQHLADRYGKSPAVMWAFFLAARQFLDNKEQE